MELISIGEASRRFNVDVNKLRRMEEQGLIESVRTAGGHRRYAAQDLQAFFDAGGQNPLPKEPVSVFSGTDLSELISDEFARWDRTYTQIPVIDSVLNGCLESGHGGLALMFTKYGAGWSQVWAQVAARVGENVPVAMALLDHSVTSAAQLMVQQAHRADYDKMRRLMRSKPLGELVAAAGANNLAMLDLVSSFQTHTVDDLELALDQAEDSMGGPCRVLLIDLLDNLGISAADQLEVDQTASERKMQVRRSLIVEHLGEMARRRDVVVLAGIYMPRNIPSGSPLDHKYLDGSSDVSLLRNQAIHHCDVILNSWRRDHTPGIDPVEVQHCRGRISIASIKHRYHADEKQYTSFTVRERTNELMVVR